MAIKIINGVKHYPMSWDYAEHKLETEVLRLQNKIDVLERGTIDPNETMIMTGGIGHKQLDAFNALPKPVRAKRINYLERVLDRMREVRDIADRYVTCDGRGRLTAWLDGKTFNAVKQICAGYELAHMMYLAS